jgi:hypothetical protein
MKHDGKDVYYSGIFESEDILRQVQSFAVPTHLQTNSGNTTSIFIPSNTLKT